MSILESCSAIYIMKNGAADQMKHINNDFVVEFAIVLKYEFKTLELRTVHLILVAEFLDFFELIPMLLVASAL
jgi:hypothetical protein